MCVCLLIKKLYGGVLCLSCYLNMMQREIDKGIMGFGVVLVSGLINVICRSSLMRVVMIN